MDIGNLQRHKHVLRIPGMWWNAWHQQSSGRRVFAALLIVGGCTLAAKLIAFLKDAIVAYRFGTGDALDAFLIALVVPQFAITIVGASLNVALIPTYIEVREREGAVAANRLMSSVVTVAMVALVLVAGLLALTAPYVLPLLASGFSQEKLNLSHSLFLVLLCVLVLHGISTVWAAVLNALDRFALVATVPVVTSVLTILAVFTLAPSYGAHALAVGTVGGAIVETGLIGWWLVREGVSLAPQWTGMTSAVQQVLWQYLPMVAGAFLMGGTTIVSMSMAAMLDPGSVATLTYGSKVLNVLLGIGATAVSTAFLPYLSRMAAAGDWNGLRQMITNATRMLVAATIPVTALLMYYSEPVVALLFQRGAFTEADTHLVAEVQVMYLLQIPAYIVGMLFVRLVSALKANHLMMWCNVLNLSLCIALTYIFIQWWGVIGIALATTVIYFVNTSVLYVLALRVLRRQEVASKSQLIPALDTV
jgi:putative peptidoglycan lipid II flippase